MSICARHALFGVVWVICSFNLASASTHDAAAAPLQDPSLQSETIAEAPSASFSSSRDETSVAAQFNLLKDNGTDIKRGWKLALGLKAPIDKGDDSKTFADLSGLSSGTVATMKYQFMWRGADLDPSKILDVCAEYDAERRQVLEQQAGVAYPKEFFANCAEVSVLPRNGSSVNWKGLQERLTPDDDSAPTNPAPSKDRDWQRDAVDAALTDLCRELVETGRGQLLLDESEHRPEGKPLCRYRALAETIDLLRKIEPTLPDKAEKAIVTALESRCREVNKSVLTEQTTDVTHFLGDEPEGGRCTTESLTANQDGARWRKKAFRAVGYSPVIFASEVSAGDKTFKFLDATTLNKSETSGTAYSVSASLGRVFLGARDTYWGIGYTDEHSFKPGEKTQVCLPLGSAGALRCDTAVIGAPEREHKKIAFSEVRSLFSEKFGIRPRINYEFAEGVIGYQLQLYFIPNSDKALTGGLDLGYRDDDKEFTIGLFVGIPLTVFGGS